MNYRHAFHAGNHADVLKHVVLTAILDALSRKDAPWFALDTHAGRARYDLDSIEARRGGEAENGIGRLADARELPPPVRRYVERVRTFDADNATRIRRYPGSPHLIAGSLRGRDRAAFVELEPMEADALRREFRGDKRVGVHCRDGYEALRGLLPPQEKRGFVLIDPPYERQAAELDLVLQALLDAHARFPNGALAAWYPIKDATTPARFETALKRSALPALLCVELCVHARDSRVGLNGSGLVIVNPPWRLDEELRAALPALHRLLSIGGAGDARVDWLREPA